MKQSTVRDFQMLPNVTYEKVNRIPKSFLLLQLFVVQVFVVSIESSFFYTQLDNQLKKQDV